MKWCLGRQNLYTMVWSVDLVEEEEDCGTLVGYVDDGAYSFGNSDPNVVSQVLTSKYTLLENWMNSNKLVINPEKTHLMVLGSRRMRQETRKVNVQVGNLSICPTDTEKLLGGQLHNSLQWNLHLSDSEYSLTRQLTSRINGLKRISMNSTFHTRLMVANGAVMSRLVYLITLWGGAQLYLLKSLQVLQLTAARVVCGPTSYRWSRTKLLGRVGWLSVRQLIQFHTILQAYKTIQTGQPRPLAFSISTQHPRDTRSAASGHIRYGGSFRNQTTFKYRALQWFNSVPPEVKQGSISTVKAKLKVWVRNNVPIAWN